MTKILTTLLASAAILSGQGIPATSLQRIGGGGGARTTTAKAVEAVPYPIKGIPQESEKFKAIFREVAAAELQNNQKGKSYITILQTIAPGKFLAEITGDKTIALDLPGATHADDTRFSLVLENSGELYRFTTVLGALRTVETYREATPANPLTTEQFLTNLQSGKTYFLPKQYPDATCKTCNGFGKTPNKGTQLRTGDAKAPCPDCDGKGKTPVWKTLHITWE
jgi:hypothetical protein